MSQIRFLVSRRSWNRSRAYHHHIRSFKLLNTFFFAQSEVEQCILRDDALYKLMLYLLTYLLTSCLEAAACLLQSRLGVRLRLSAGSGRLTAPGRVLRVCVRMTRSHAVMRVAI